MHYGDKEQIEKQKLKLVIYSHQYLGTKKTDFQVTSIQKCCFFPPYVLSNIIREPNKFFRNQKETKNLKHEKYWLVELTILAGSCVIKNIKNVTESKNEFYFLH